MSELAYTKVEEGMVVADSCACILQFPMRDDNFNAEGGKMLIRS